MEDLNKCEREEFFRGFDEMKGFRENAKICSDPNVEALKLKNLLCCALLVNDEN